MEAFLSFHLLLTLSNINAGQNYDQHLVNKLMFLGHQRQKDANRGRDYYTVMNCGIRK